MSTISWSRFSASTLPETDALSLSCITSALVNRAPQIRTVMANNQTNMQGHYPLPNDLQAGLDQFFAGGSSAAGRAGGAREGSQELLSLPQFLRRVDIHEI